MNTMKRADLLLIVVVLIVSVFGVAWSQASPAKPGAEMIVRQNNREVLRVDLTDSGEDSWTFGEPGHQNVVQRKGKRVRVVEADCPDQICVKQGWAEKSGDQLLCVPHRLLVEIRSKEAGTIDALAK